jgi:hypothetical protein
MNGVEYSEDLDVNGRTVDVKEIGWKVWSRLIWLRIGANNKSSDFINPGSF